jgi:hypothetical protein
MRITRHLRDFRGVGGSELIEAIYLSYAYLKMHVSI